MSTKPESWGWLILTNAVRAAVFGVVIVMVFIGASMIYEGRQGEALKYQKATACILAATDTRTVDWVTQCYYQNGLTPPEFPAGDGG